MDLREANDEWLMTRVAQGRQPELEELMRRYHKPLHAFLIHNGCTEDAEDVYQETWIKIVRARQSYDPSKKFSTWLFGIALNTCRDAHRAALARPGTVPLEAAANVPAPQPEPDFSGATELLAALSQTERELLSLRYYQGMKETEVAVLLGIPVGTVKSRCHEAIGKLRKLASEDKNNDR